MKVKGIMEQPVNTCALETDLESIANIMSKQDCGAIVVVDPANHPVGLVTDRDIVLIAALKHMPLWEIPCSEVTNSQDVFTCSIDDETITVLKKMEQHKVRRMPVVNSNDEAQGIITIDDLVHLAQERDDVLFHQTIDTLKAVSKHH